ncbi:MAG: tRNA epoxyqueuosine(34) reductase QueG [Acidobacteria bacterium]|nr:tRNA epoxyqueuosine(34) reductase QueG [Acidobacteriota bacterium]
MDHPGADEFKDWLRARALELGMARVGFASLEPFTSQESRLRAWFQSGRGELLPYLDPEALMDPHTPFPEGRAALVGFFPYARPDAVPGRVPDSLKLSRYVWGEDYHLILKHRLAALLEEAQGRWPGLEGRVCVDTAPILERQLATRAGLGWQGKHTLLIMGKEGSWGFLAVLLLSVELQPDRPFEAEHCGTCTACLEACPSGALEPFRLDPALCLTTYTIETEAEPPPRVLAALKESRWAAGCDACQEACPWNQAPVWGDPALWGAPDELHEVPGEALRLGANQWRRRTKRRALRRVRQQHWLKTVARILGPGPGHG